MKKNAPTNKADESATHTANCNLPEPNTRRAHILEALQRGDTLTHVDGLNRGWGWRLAADIHALREMGWPIETLEVHQAAGGNPIARYRLAGGAR